ncbi:MAG: 16S rRNA (uracil(1498)-N(3))-methyltransferase [Bacteroidota bacterium]
MQLFYCPDINSEIYFLSEEESKHCIGVLRHKKEDAINLIDGVGGFYIAKIIGNDKKKCEVKIISKQIEFSKRNYQLHIAIAPTKNTERFEWFLEKATEIGIDEITPLICEHSERKELKIERLNKVIVSAMKQSVKAYLPKLNAAIKFKDFIQHSNTSQKFICSCDAEKKSTLKNFYTKEKDVLLLIGPEGDFSKDEIELANTNGYKTISLGDGRLRTETAGIVTCEIINFINSN